MDLITDLLRQRAQEAPQKNAALYLQDGEQETTWLTYGELDENAKNIAIWIQEKQMAGSRILLLYPSGTEFITGLLGCWYAGAIAVPISCPKSDDFESQQTLLKTIAKDADISAIFTLHTLELAVKSHLTKSLPVLSTDTLKKNNKKHYKPVRIHAETIAYLQYTSGSTATPKAAVVTHGNLQHSINTTLNVWRYAKHSITLNWAPHTHVYGLVCGILMPLYHGTLTIIIPVAAVIKNPLVWLTAISKYRVTHSGCPNFGYDLCVRNIEDASLAHLKLQHWKVAVNGGDIVQPQTLTAFANKFRSCGFQLKQFCSAYGMSELSGAIAATPYGREPKVYSLPSDNRERISSGHLLPGLHVIAVDPDTGRPVSEGEIGEIWISGQSVVNGYWQRPTETNEVFNATLPGNSRTYFRTGDLGCLHHNELYLTGRLKEVMVIYGKKYYPLDLEITVAQALAPFQIKLPQVVFSAEINNQESMIVVQELTVDFDPARYHLLDEAIRHAITKEHGVNIHQVSYVAAGMIPKTTSGKLQRKKCQLLLEQNQLTFLTPDNKTDIVSSNPHTGQITQFIDLVATVLKVDADKVDMQAPLSRYAFDSINIIHLTTLLNETYQLSVSPASLYEYATLSDFYNHWLNKETKAVTKEPVKEPTNQTHDIAIIGMSGLFPQSPNQDAFWDNLIEGKDCISQVPTSRWDYTDNTIPWGGFIEGLDQFDAHFFNISPREAALIDPQQRLFLETVWKTIEDAGYTKSTLQAFKTGLFVGVFNHDYAELLQKNDVMDAYLTTSTLHSMIANRISYLFNFNGPSEAIDTACSSSLVAIHHAVRAIQQGDCELAIAGGVNALITPTAFIAARKAGMLSEDGRCKTFDQNANGYVRSEGSGAILLKKLSQAISDNDCIYGIIKGTAINHGGHANSLTAPNPNAQADVIIAACQRAHIPVDTIQFIETHGTGTPLGDPIEINGLKKAFEHLAREQKITTLPQQYCGLGALKTNIGHLESAAGIAGVIKLLLAMKHEAMPANLHFNQLNPYIKLEDSPFYLVNQTTPWPKTADATPRRAGISSFGFGGANAHIILEECPKSTKHCNPIDNKHPQHDRYILPLSAMTLSALQQRIADLLIWLKRQPKAPCLAALSYTLAVGREHFAHRFAMVVRTLAELEEQLSAALSTDQYLTITPKGHAICDDYLRGNVVDWQQLYGNFQEKLSLPTYPFAQESHWINSPFAIAGFRGQAAESRRLDYRAISKGYWINTNEKLAQHVHPFIDDDLSTATTIQFRKQFTGNEFYVTEHQINHEQVLPGVACIEMASAATRLAAIIPEVTTLKHIIWQKPIKHSDLIDPIHVTLAPEERSVFFRITDHTDATVFVKGEIEYTDNSNTVEPLQHDIQALKSSLSHHQTSEEVYHYFKQAGIIYGPRFQVIQALYHNETHVFADLALPASLLTDAPTFIFHPCLLDGILQTTQALLKKRDTLYIPVSIRQMKRYGALPDVCHVYAQQASQEVQDDLVSCDIQVFDPKGRLVLSVDGFTLRSITQKSAPLQNTIAYYQPTWIEKPLLPGELEDTASIVILGHCETTIRSIREQFTHHHITEHIIQNPEDTHHVQLSLADYVIIALEPCIDHDFSERVIQASLEKTYYLTHAIARQLIQLKPQQRMQMIFVSQTQSVFSRALVGLSKTLPLEQLNIVCRYLELSNLAMLKHELTQPDIDVRYEGDKRHVSTYQVLANTPTHSLSPMLKQSGVYLITGGLGGLGYLFATHLAEHYQAKLILTGRSPLSKHHRQLLTHLKKKTSSVVYIQADVSSQNNVQMLIQDIKKQFGQINGIIHSAGVTQDGLMIHKTTEHMKAVAAPKIYGTCYLHTATANEPLDFFVLFSSIAATFGNAGQSDYAYANAFLDEFSRCREQLQLLGQCSGRTLSINWPLWQEGGLTIAPEYQQWLEQTMGIVSLNTHQGIEAFTQLLESPINNGIVLPGHQSLLINTLERRVSIDPSHLHKPDAEHQVLHRQTTHFLKQLLADTIQRPMEQIDETVALEQYGIDSLMIIDLNQRLSKQFTGLPQTLFFEYQTLSALTQYFIDHRAQELNQYFSDQPGNTYDVLQPIDMIKPHPAELDHAPLEADRSTDDDIAIIGIDGRYPQSNDLTEFWNNLISGKNCITEIPDSRWNWRDYYDVNPNEKNKTYSKWGGFLAHPDQFDPLFFNISPREASLMDPQERLFLETAWKTIENAGYPREQLAGKKVGVYVGVMYGEYALFGNESSSSSFVPTHAMFSSIANRVSYWFDFHGPSLALDTMCSSSLTAIHLACQSIRDGECSLALAGGVNLSLHQNKYLLLSHGKFLSSEGRCRSFGEGGDGYVPGEGVGAVLLKPLAQALQDGDYVYAVIKGSQINHGGKTNGYTVPNPNAQAQLIAETYHKANLSPSSVSYIEAHGTGTSLGDPIEVAGLNRVFSQADRTNPCALGSVKSNIGHCESAAGIAAVTKVVLQLQHRTLVPSLMSETLNPNIQWESTPFRVQQTVGEWRTSDIIVDGQQQSAPRIAGVSSFGAGGSNAHLILSEPPKQTFSPNPLQSSYLLTLSAKTVVALKQRVNDLLAWIGNNPSANIEQISYTLNCGRTHFNHRCALIVDSIDQAAHVLQQLDAQSSPDKILMMGDDHNQASCKCPSPCGTNSHNELAGGVVARHEAIQSSEHGTLDCHASLATTEPGGFCTNCEVHWEPSSLRDDRTMLIDVANRYLEGKEIDWQTLHENNNRKKIPLPTYPFAKEHYWYTNTDHTEAESSERLLPEQHSSIDQVASFLVQQVTQILKLAQHNVSIEKNLGEYGMDSVHFIELSKSISNHYQIQLTPAIWNTYTDLSAISQYLVNQYPEQVNRVHQYHNISLSMNTPRLNIQPQRVAEQRPTSPLSSSEDEQDIAIIGMQALFPHSDDLTSFWQQMMDGKDFVTEIPPSRWNWQDYFGDSTNHTDKTNSKWGSFINQIDQFDAGFFNLSTREANLMDPQHRLFLEIVWKTIEDAGYNPFDLSAQNVGVFAGIEFSEYQSLIAKQHTDFHGFIASGNAHSMLANRISYFFNFHGPSEAIDTACSSSSVAIHRAVQALRQHECNVAIAGGVSIILNPDTYIITSQLGALSPDGRCKTFDQNANGYVKGEGIAALLLKPLHQAKLDGDAIYGVIKASAVNHGGKAQSLTAPNASAQSSLLINAYTQSGIDPNTITMIETHGTGTMLGDPVEVQGKRILNYLPNNGFSEIVL